MAPMEASIMQMSTVGEINFCSVRQFEKKSVSHSALFYFFFFFDFRVLPAFIIFNFAPLLQQLQMGSDKG